MWRSTKTTRNYMQGRMHDAGQRKLRERMLGVLEQ